MAAEGMGHIAGRTANSAANVENAVRRLWREAGNMLFGGDQFTSVELVKPEEIW